jgi:anti-sigma factor RsiW
MNCESVTEQIRALAEGSLDDEQRIACKNHIATCQDCADALRGVRAMLVVRDQATVPGSERVFNRVMSKAGYDPQQQASRKGFWLGTRLAGKSCRRSTPGGGVLGIDTGSAADEHRD